MTEQTYLMTLGLVYAFCWGAIWGSFLNVVVWRLPRGMNLARPGSHCPKCETPIKWYDNIPIFGWLRLKGRCRACGVWISPRYPIVELVVAILGALLWWHVARQVLDVELFQVALIPWIFHFFFVFGLVGIALIDADLTVIPDELTLPLMGWGLLGALLTPKTGAFIYYAPAVDIVDAGIGLAVGFGMIAVIFIGYRVLTGRYGLGWGDATLLGAIGANLGWQSLVFVLLASSLQGLLAAVGIAIYDRASGREAGGEGSALLKGAHTDAFWEEDPLEAERARAAGETDAAEGIEAAADAVDVDAATVAADGGADTASAEDDDEGGFMQLALPFGPFLALAAIEYIFFGRAFLSWLTAGALP